MSLFKSSKIKRKATLHSANTTHNRIATQIKEMVNLKNASMLLKVLNCVEKSKDEIVNDESYKGNPVVHQLPVDRTILIQDLNEWVP